MVEDPKEPSLGELHALVLKLEQRDDLVNRIAKLSTPASPVPRWYDRPVLVGFLATLVAAVVPSVTAVNGCVAKSTELELDKQRLAHQVSSDFTTSYALKEALTQALDPALSQTHRFRALRFLMDTAPDQAVRDWAHAEYSRAEENLAATALERSLSAKDGGSISVGDALNPVASQGSLMRTIEKVLQDNKLDDETKQAVIESLALRLRNVNTAASVANLARRQSSPEDLEREARQDLLDRLCYYLSP